MTVAVIMRVPMVMVVSVLMPVLVAPAANGQNEFVPWALGAVM